MRAVRQRVLGVWVGCTEGPKRACSKTEWTCILTVCFLVCLGDRSEHACTNNACGMLFGSDNSVHHHHHHRLGRASVWQARRQCDASTGRKSGARATKFNQPTNQGVQTTNLPRSLDPQG